ncbi:MAG: 2-oxoacid:acceptor oxidoreductase family protein [Candidatus Omnitrophica bacterium]|nr:2-oxoacid:acceptor oxidoreductase family protein [Candidatus Omnitrophota bacterium]
MIEKIIIAGAGGQGVMLLGKILAQAGLKEKRFVSWLPAYGAEVRGGTAYCMVIISDREIGSPYIEKADILIIMNALSLEKFKERIKPQGLLVLNSSLVDTPKLSSHLKLKLYAYAFSDIALELGNIKVANIVALGAVLAKKGFLKPESVLKTMEEIAPKEKRKILAINKRALLRGMELE